MATSYRLDQLPNVSAAWLAQNRTAAVLAMRDSARQATAHYQARIQAEKAVDTGFMRQAFAVDHLDNGAIVTNAATYFTVMDQGRRPGAAGPPLRPIMEWVARKQIIGSTRAAVSKSVDLATELLRVSQLIRASIHRKGIKARNIASGAANTAKIWTIVQGALRRQMSETPGRPM